MNTNKTRHEIRKSVLFIVYQNLLNNRDLDELLEDSFDIEAEPYFYEMVKEIFQNKEVYVSQLTPFLKKDWSFNRLSYIEQAILLCGTYELNAKQIDRAVILDEYVRFAKEYGDKSSYEFINGVLDNL